MRRLMPLLGVLALAWLSGCREGLAPFDGGASPADTTGVLRATFSPADDLYPSWAAGGLSILYAGGGIAGGPAGRGLLYSVPVPPGTADLVFDDLQGAGSGGPRWLASPAQEPGGNRVAYLDVAGVSAAVAGDTVGCDIAEPLVDSLVLRVRRRGERAPIFSDPSIAFRVPGRDPGQRGDAPGPFTMREFPSQARFREMGWLSQRASWSPDGRVVFSDGLDLYVWSGGVASAVPGVTDAATPAWSPDGDRIAYTRLERGDSTVEHCTVVRGAGVAVQHERIGYAWPRSTIAVVRPDGSGAADLVEGTDPAWSPDGQWIYYRANDRIERIPASGGRAESVPDTQGGWWPAVSPDGARLAFMRKEGNASWDIWSVPVPR